MIQAAQVVSAGGQRVKKLRRGLRRGAFTLIELLVVIGVIALLTGTFAVALSGRGGEGAALANAQVIVNGLVHTARAQAAIYQTNAYFVVYGQMPPGQNGESDRYLRTCMVVREDPADNTRLIAAGDPVTLPAPICIVPPAPVPTTHLGLPTGQSWNNTAATGPVSTLERKANFSYRGQAKSASTQFFGRGGGSGQVLWLKFAPDGTVALPAGLPAGTPIKIAMATVTLAPNALPKFNNATGVRGVMIRKTGAVSLVNDATGF
jgi:prepilin-type N-terminal cleavage/methylation domain-containing protein